MHIVALLTTLVIIGFMTFDGYRSGLYRAAYTLLRHVLAFLVAMTFCVPVAGLLLKVVPNFELHPGPEYLRVISFAALFGLVTGLAQYLRNRFTVLDLAAELGLVEAS